jgi:hypothetical protein
MNYKKRFVGKDFESEIAAVPSEIYGKRFENFVNNKVLTKRNGIRFTGKMDYIKKILIE